MGRRARRRTDGAAPAADSRPRPSGRAERPSRRGAGGQRPGRLDRFLERAEERPKPPWHPFPLVELCVLAGIVLIVLGIIGSDTRDGRTLLLFGLVLASLAGFDTALREHLAGFRSHSLLLAGVPALLVAGALYFARAPWLVLIVLAAAAFIGVFAYLRSLFSRRSGGRAFRR